MEREFFGVGGACDSGVAYFESAEGFAQALYALAVVQVGCDVDEGDFEFVCESFGGVYPILVGAGGVVHEEYAWSVAVCRVGEVVGFFFGGGLCLLDGDEVDAGGSD